MDRLRERRFLRHSKAHDPLIGNNLPHGSSVAAHLFRRRLFFVVPRGTNNDLLNRRRTVGAVLSIPRRADDLVRNFHPFRDPSEDGVLAVERWCVGCNDEEL